MSHYAQSWVVRSFSKLSIVAVMLVAASGFYLLFPGATSVAAAPGQIDGIVFRDYDADGTQDADEPGLSGVEVYVIETNGTESTTTTNATGAYTIGGLAGQVRIEYRLTAAQQGYLYPGTAGNTSVQFADASAGATINVGFNNPAQYSQTNPQVASSIFRRNENAGQNDTVVLSHAYNVNGTGQTLTPYATANQAGTIYGLAYQSASDVLFGSTYIRRGASVGPTNSTGTIYKLTGTGAPSTFIDLNATGVISTGVNPHPNGSGVDWIVDSATYAAVGKVGLGDIDLSDDEQTLYAVNLFERELVVLPMTFDGTGQPIAPTVGSIITRTIPVPATCNGNGTTAPAAADWRPFGLTYYDGQLYVGGVCGAQTMLESAAPSTIGDLAAVLPEVRAHIYQFDPATNTFNTTPILSFPLNYGRERVNDNMVDAGNDGEWLPWNDDWRPGYAATTGSIVANPQPMLVDIEIDGDGFMTIGFRDRFADQAFASGDPGPNNVATTGQRFGGDVLLACLDAGGNWQLESGSSCTNGLTSETRTAGGSADSGYSLDEFYHNDQYVPNGTNAPLYHDETAWGALALRHGSGEILVTKYDTFATFEAGTIAFDEDNGDRIRAVQMYTNTTERFGKAGGIGDIELLSDLAPTEIGNRIWLDADADGLQDPGETGINNVTIELWADTDGNTTVDTKVAETTTDTNGQYLFSQAGTNAYGETEDWSFYGGDGDQVDSNTAYEIRVDMTQGSLNTFGLTNHNAAQPVAGNTAVTDNNPFTDLADSDAVTNGSTAVIAYTTDFMAGSNNHTLDMGFTTADRGDLPDTFDTTASTSGAIHSLSNNLYLGACVDSDADGQPDGQAGDDGSGGDNNAAGGTTYGTCASANNDEDGITLTTPLIAGAQACVAVTAVNSTGSAANLYGWLDFDGDGQFDGDANELINTGDFTGGVATVNNGGVSNASYCFTVPSGATFTGGETHMRFRLTSNTLGGATPWAGTASDGEVEDYYTPLACVGNYVWYDADNSGGQNEAGTNGINGLVVNLVWAGPNDTFGNGDDVTYTTTTALAGGVNGKYQFCGLTPDAADTYRIDIPTPAQAYPLATTANATGDLADSDGTQSGGLGTAVTGPTFTIASPINLTTTENSTGDTPGTLNGYPDNRDDLRFDFGFQAAATDWGDLPNSYETTYGSNGANHTVSGPYLGSCVDTETSGAPGGTATGDNAAAGGATTGTCTTPNDDEDGIVSTGNWSDGTGDLSVTVNGGDGCLNVWVDFTDGTTIGGDGDMNDTHTGGFSEHVVQNLQVTTGTAPVSFNLPASAANNASWYIRARLTPRDSGGVCTGADTYTAGSPTSSGNAIGGEVEDYQFGFNPTAVSLSTASANSSNGNPVVILVSLILLIIATGIGAYPLLKKTK